MSKNSQLSKTPYKGCRDLFPEEKRIQEFLFHTFSKTAKSFGFEPYDGPLLEPVELYLAKSGQELINEQIYSFTDRGDRTVAIRPEMTPTLARMIAQVYRELPLPIRWFSIPNLMRYERPQKGRLREHWQFNCDIFGLESPYGELEIFQLIALLFHSFGAGAQHFSIHFNSRELLEELSTKLLKLSDEQSYQFYKLIDRSKKITNEEFQKELTAFSSDDSKLKNILESYFSLGSIPSLSAFLNQYEIQAPQLRLLLQELSNSCYEDLNPLLCYDPSIVRGLDYYTGIVFEVFNLHPEHNRALCGGGSYDNLLSIFKEGPLRGIGFGLGDVTLKDFLQVHHLLPSFKFAHTHVLLTALDEESSKNISQISAFIRKHNIQCEVMWGISKLKKAFHLSEVKGHQKLIILGDSQNPKSIIIKDTKSRNQKIFQMDDLSWITYLQEGLTHE